MARKRKAVTLLPKLARSLKESVATNLPYKYACPPLGVRTAQAALFVLGVRLGMLNHDGSYTRAYLLPKKRRVGVIPKSAG